MWRKSFVAAFAVVMAGCSAGRQFPAIPASLNIAAVPDTTIEMKAERYQFVPEEIRVKTGTLVILRIEALDTTHGFDLPAFGIDERLEKHRPIVVRFYVGEKGEYDFKCSHFCGLGHFGMTGKVVVE
jgi:cytochrome c oxidase subunit 2